MTRSTWASCSYKQPASTIANNDDASCLECIAAASSGSMDQRTTLRSMRLRRPRRGTASSSSRRAMLVSATAVTLALATLSCTVITPVSALSSHLRGVTCRTVNWTIVIDQYDIAFDQINFYAGSDPSIGAWSVNVTASQAGIPSKFPGGFLTTNVDLNFGQLLELDAPDVVGFTLQNSTAATATTMASGSGHEQADESDDGHSSMMPFQQLGQRLMHDFSACSHAGLPAGFMSGNNNATTLTLGNGDGSSSGSGPGPGDAETTTVPVFANPAAGAGPTATSSTAGSGEKKTPGLVAKPSSSTSKTSSSNNGEDEVQGSTDVVQPNSSSKTISIIASVISSVVATMVLGLIGWAARKWWLNSERYKRRKRAGILWEHEQDGPAAAAGAAQDDEGKSAAAQDTIDGTTLNASSPTSHAVASSSKAQRVRAMLQVDTSPTALSPALARGQIARTGGSGAAEETDFTPSAAAESTPLSPSLTAQMYTPATTIATTHPDPHHVALRMPATVDVASPVYESQPAGGRMMISNPFQHPEDDNARNDDAEGPARNDEGEEQLPPPQYAESVRSTEITLPPTSDGVLPPDWSHFQLLSPFSPTTVYQHPLADQPRRSPPVPMMGPASHGQQPVAAAVTRHRPTLTLQRHNTDGHVRHRRSSPALLDPQPLSAVVLSGRRGADPFRDGSGSEDQEEEEGTLSTDAHGRITTTTASKPRNGPPSRRPSSVGTTRELLDALVDDRSEEHFWQ